MHAGGTIIKKDLQPGETLLLDTGCLVAMTGTVDYDVRFSGSVKTALFGARAWRWPCSPGRAACGSSPCPSRGLPTDLCGEQGGRRQKQGRGQRPRGTRDREPVRRKQLTPA
jgi:hypothetical protein